MTIEPTHTPSKARIFFSIFLSGFWVMGLLHMGRGDGSSSQNPIFSMIVSGANTGGYFAASFICAFVSAWKWPLFIRITLTHVAAASLLGFLNYGQQGFAYALSSALPCSVMIATPSWIMAGTNWLLGKILFWALIGILGLGTLMWIFK